MKHFETMGRFLKDKRINADLTQLDLSDKLGLSSQMVSNWERGLCAPPSNCLKKLAKLLAIDNEEMLRLFLSSKEQLLRMSLGLPRKPASAEFRLARHK